MFTVDSALQHTCASFREQAARGEITAGECDLLIDGAVLLAVHLEALIQDARAASHRPGWMPAAVQPRASWRAAGLAREHRPDENVLAASGVR